MASQLFVEESQALVADGDHAVNHQRENIRNGVSLEYWGNAPKSAENHHDSSCVRGEPRTATQILILDDHMLLGTTLRMALASGGIPAKQLTVGGGIPEIMAQACLVAPDLVLLDLNLGFTEGGRRIDAVDLVAPLCARRAAVLVLAEDDDLHRIAAAVAAGAVGVISKSSSFEQLRETVVAVAAGDEVMSIPARQDLLMLHRDYQAQQRVITQRLERLSPREREVLDLLALGHRTSAIAERFVVTRNTVRSQIRGILVKLDVNSQLEAAALFRGHGGLQDGHVFTGITGTQRFCFRCGKTEVGHRGAGRPARC